MSTTSPNVSAAARRAGRIVTALPVLFLLMDGAMKFSTIPAVVDGTRQLGWSPELLPVLGALTLVSLALYLVPRTAVLGAILLTGYLGGAVATHLRLGNPLLTHVLFPTYLGALLWGGLWLRDARVRALIPLPAWDRRAEPAVARVAA
jgi:hypothetical protein